MKLPRPQPRWIIQGALWSGLVEILLLSGSLLGTRAHIADKSSRSWLCWTWLRNAGKPLWHRLEFGLCDLELVCILYLAP